MKGAQREDRLALGLLAAWATAQFVWPALPDSEQFAGWTASQSMFTALVLGVMGALVASFWVRCALALAGACYLLSFGCSAAWLVHPFDTTGRGRCSDALNLPAGVLAAALALLLVWLIYRESRDG